MEQAYIFTPTKNTAKTKLTEQVRSASKKAQNLNIMAFFALFLGTGIA
ncbi:hypothetical protein ACFSKL_05950 [Belliella marina]|uniref:Uncharacterized protein n=1 Tax=Belliella marina TaxID=1644146 RepID=A0ABW4VHY5_9BACT